jgi:hypothetical protein
MKNQPYYVVRARALENASPAKAATLIAKVFSRLAYAIEEYDKENPLDLPPRIKALLRDIKKQEAMLVTAGKQGKIDDLFWKTHARRLITLMEQGGTHFSDMIIFDPTAHSFPQWFFLGGACSDRMNAAKFLRGKLEGPQKIQLDPDLFHEEVDYFQRTFREEKLPPPHTRFDTWDEAISTLMHEGLDNQTVLGKTGKRGR